MSSLVLAPCWWSLLSLHPSSSILPGNPPSLLWSVSAWSLGSENTWVRCHGWEWVTPAWAAVCELWEADQAPNWCPAGDCAEDGS